MAIASSPSRWVSPRLLLCALLLATLGGLPAALPLARSADDAPGAAAAPATAAAEMVTRAYSVWPGTLSVRRGDKTVWLGGYDDRYSYGDDDDDDDDEGEANVAPEDIDDGGVARQLFEEIGLQFPAGSSFHYSRQTKKLVIHTSRSVMEQVDRSFGWFCNIGPSQIRITVTVIRIGTQTAADWGLDGLPAARPETSPFAGAVPRTMTATQSATFFAALRKTEGFEVLGSTELLTISGQTANVQGVERERLVESFTEPEFIEQEDGTVSMSPAAPELGEEQRFGVQLTVTPTIGDDNYTIDLELRPSYTEVIGNKTMPSIATFLTADGRTVKVNGDMQGVSVIQEYSVETRVIMGKGSTMLIGTAQRKTLRDPAMFPNETRIPTDPRPVFFVLTADVVPITFYETLD